MSKRTIIRLQVILISAAIISAQIALYLWLPFMVTLLLIIVINALGFVGLLELVNPKE